MRAKLLKWQQHSYSSVVEVMTRFLNRTLIVPFSLALCFFVFILLSYWSPKSAIQTRDENADAVQRQITRKNLMKDFCLTHSYKKKLDLDWNDTRHILVDDKNKIMYCFIPKVGSRTWKTVLANLQRVEQKRDYDVGTRIQQFWRRFGSYTEEEKSERIQTYFKFLFVREPLHRLLSAYKDKFIGLRTSSIGAREEIVKLYRPQDFEPNGDNRVSFTEFIHYFSRNDVSRNEHWLQYEHLCQPCVINYDFIGHLETLEEDAHLLLKMAGIEDRVTFPSMHHSTGTDEVLEYYSQVPPEYITRLGEQYRNDFEMFGYEYLGPVKKLLN